MGGEPGRGRLSPPSSTGRPLARRSLLILGGSVLLAACAAPPRSGVRLTSDDDDAVSDVRSLVGGSSFLVAHRGSGDNWPEHTLTAYRSSLDAGADAVEISVCATSDGVLVCHHDLSALRTLGVDRRLSDMTWAELQAAPVDARRWLGPETPLEPVPRLEDVLDELGDDVLAFVEDKQGTNTRALLDVLDARPRAQDRFVWKQWAGAAQVNVAVERGYATWGYFDEDQADRVEEFAATFDVLGVPVGSTDALIERAVATGRPVMAWEVHLHADVQRLRGLGVAGLMCSNVPYLLATAAASGDSFGSGMRSAGDLPGDFGQLGWSSQPLLVPERAALRVQRSGSADYLMGSLAVPARSLTSVSTVLRWPDAVPAAGSAGLAVALTSDDGGEASGYEVTVDVAGTVAIDEVVDGARGTRLGSATVPAPQQGTPVRLTVELDDARLRVGVDGAAPVLEVADDRWRGAWFRLVKAYETPQAVEFSEVGAELAD